MGCLGLHFSLDADQVAALRAVDNKARVEFVQAEFEETLWSADKSRAQETDKAWDAIHRAVTDGTLGWKSGEYPLNHVILGGESLYVGDDYILSLKWPEQVGEVSAAIRGVTKERLRAGYDRIDPEAYGMPLSADDFEYTWEWFEGVVNFYQRAAEAGHAVLFTADQ
jgi:hypothetical protein